MTKTHTKRVLAALTASLLSLSLLAACGGQDSAADASTQPDASQAQTDQQVHRDHRGRVHHPGPGRQHRHPGHLQRT